MIICPSCGTENRDTATFCGRCARLLKLPTAPANAEPEALAETTATMEVGDRITETTPTIEVGDQTPETVPALPAVGDQLEGRYTIVEVISTTAAKVVYRARDERRCAECNTENTPGETFCQNCGRALDTPAICLLELSDVPSDPASVSAPDFIRGNRWYHVQVEPAKSVQSKPFPHGVRLSYAMKSDVGLVRGADGGTDEDSVFALALSAMHESIAQPTIGVFFVADGIGGADAGEVASKLCAQTLVPELLANIVSPMLAGNELDDAMARDLLAKAIQNANLAILQAAQTKGNDMGTTLTLALVIDAKAYVANVGDSRTYVFDAGKLTQISRDHSLVAKLVELEQIQPADIYTHPQRNVILKSLGAKPELEVDIFPAEGGALELKPAMRLLLCCDGLWEMVRDDELETELLREDDPQQVCETLIARANQAGGDDNISVVVVKVEA